MDDTLSNYSNTYWRARRYVSQAGDEGRFIAALPLDPSHAAAKVLQQRLAKLGDASALYDK